MRRYEHDRIEPSPQFLEAMARQREVSTDFLLGLSQYPHEHFSEPPNAEQIQLLDVTKQAIVQRLWN